MIIRLVFNAYIVSVFALMFWLASKEKNVDEVIKVKDIELIFKRAKDIDKFIDEYRELIIWLDNKYSTFKEDIKEDYWIQRIIKEHDEVLVDLRSIISSEENKYLVFNEEKINKILDRCNESNKQEKE